MQKPRKINVFLFSQEKNYFANIEEARLRRTLKNALELNNVKHIISPIDEDIKIVHYLNFEDFNKFSYFKNKKFIKAVSVLVAEGDKKGRLIHKTKNKETKELEYHITKRNVEILNGYDYVIAPSEEARYFLKREGVITSIKILPPAIKLTKVKLENTGMANIAYIYFHLEEGTKYFFVPIDVLDDEAIERVLKLSYIFSNYRFIVSVKKLGVKESKKVKKSFKRHPNNLIIGVNLEEDVYYSTVYRSSGFILVNDSPLFIEETMDSFASKKPVFALKNSVFKDIVIDKVNAHVYNNFDSLIEGIDEFIKGTSSDFTEKAYEYALDNRVQTTGERLIELYNDMLKEKNI